MKRTSSCREERATNRPRRTPELASTPGMLAMTPSSRTTPLRATRTRPTASDTHATSPTDTDRAYRTTAAFLRARTRPKPLERDTTRHARPPWSMAAALLPLLPAWRHTPHTHIYTTNTTRTHSHVKLVLINFASVSPFSAVQNLQCSAGSARSY